MKELLGIAVMFYIPYLVVMFFYGRKAVADAKSAQEKLIREIAYDAAAYAFEQTAKYKSQGKTLTGSEKMDLAYTFMCKKLSIKREDAEKVIESILAKVAGAGASGQGKIK